MGERVLWHGPGSDSAGISSINNMADAKTWPEVPLASGRLMLRVIRQRESVLHRYTEQNASQNADFVTLSY